VPEIPWATCHEYWDKFSTLAVYRVHVQLKDVTNVDAHIPMETWHAPVAPCAPFGSPGSLWSRVSRGSQPPVQGSHVVTCLAWQPVPSPVVTRNFSLDQPMTPHSEAETSPTNHSTASPQAYIHARSAGDNSDYFKAYDNSIS
jgi:hypothetical protein